MYSQGKYDLLKEKYGTYSSWAIWNETIKNDTGMIDDNVTELHSQYVLLGLNISKPLLDTPWSNFHGGKNDRKLMYACNDTALRGSYLTDLFKGIPEAKSAKLYAYVKQNPDVLAKNVSVFKQEMADIGVRKNTVFIVLGKGILPFYLEFFGNDFKNPYVCYPHYASHGTDKDWVEGLWNELGIKKEFVKR